MTGVENLLIFRSGRHDLYRGDNFTKFIDRKSHRGAFHGTLGQGALI